jgi:hypothetical protein
MTSNVSRVSLTGVAACVLAATLLLPQLPPSGRTSGFAFGDEDWAPLTILYTSDVKGKIDPCG